jgi:hypothetical protein
VSLVTRSWNHNPEYNTLPARDPAWARTTLPLLRHMRARGPVTIDDVVLWGRNMGHTGNGIRHMLAWLSFNDIVFYNEETNLWEVRRKETS